MCTFTFNLYVEAESAFSDRNTLMLRHTLWNNQNVIKNSIIKDTIITSLFNFYSEISIHAGGVVEVVDTELFTKNQWPEASSVLADLL